MSVSASSPSDTTDPGWLYGPLVDSLIMFGPWLLVVLGTGLSMQTALAVWIAQFVLGGTSHVILTFVMLGVRRDVLHATPSQAGIVIAGSLTTFALFFALFVWVGATFPNWTDFPIAVVMLLGIHHRLSQARGVWSLYNLRSGKLGTPPPPPRERALSQHWTSIGLVLVATNWLFVPSGPDREFPLLQAIPQQLAPLPYATSYVLLGIWLCFVGLVAATFVRQRARRAKMLHVGTHAGAVSLSLLYPVWGSIVWGAIHGLEYYFLCARMLGPREGDKPKGLPRAWVWPVVLGSLAPLLLVGVFNAPFAAAIVGSRPRWFLYALHAVNALVMAHYFADAFIYRFRIPSVRRVALHRLGFS